MPLQSEVLKKTIIALKPSSNLTVSEWAAENRYMTSYDSPAAGQLYSLDRVPYTTGVMDYFSNPKIRMIVLKWSTQLGKTNSMMSMLAYTMAERPGPVMLALPTTESVERFSATRIDPMVDASPILRELKLKNWRRQEKHFAGGVVYLATSQSSAQLSSSSVEVVMCDELKDFQTRLKTGGADPIKYAIDRTKTFPFTKKIVLVSSPSVVDSPIDKYFKSCEEKVSFWVRCPHCNERFLFDFKHIKFGEEEFDFDVPLEKEDSRYWVAARKHAYYQCEHCEGKITDSMKPKVVRGGEWLREDQSELPEDATSVGTHLNSIYSLDLKFGDIAYEFLESKDDRSKFENFITGWLAQDWENDSIGMKAEDMQKNICDLEPTQVPQGTIALTAGVDCQKDHFYFSVYAWDKQQNGHMIHHGTVKTFEEVRALVFDNEYPIVDSEETMSIWRCAIDTGGGTSQNADGTVYSMVEACYSFIRKEGQGKIFGIKGSSHNMGGTRIKMSTLDKYPNGRVMPGGLALYILNTSELKDSFFWRLDREAGDNHQIYFNMDVDETWFKHMTSEKKVVNKKGAWEWKQVRKRNDYLDTCIYNLAVIDPQFAGGLSVIHEPVGLNKIQEQIRTINAQQDSQPSYLDSVHRRSNNNSGGWLKRRK